MATIKEFDKIPPYWQGMSKGMNIKDEYLEKACEFDLDEYVKLKKYPGMNYWYIVSSVFSIRVDTEFTKTEFDSFEEGFREYEIYKVRKECFVGRAVSPRVEGVRYTHWYMHIIPHEARPTAPIAYNTEDVDWLRSFKDTIPTEGVIVPVPVESELRKILGYKGDICASA